MAEIVKKETRELECILTEQQVAEQANLLAAKIQESAEVEHAFEGVKKQYKSKLEVIDGQIALAARRVSTKSEYRSVDCEWTFSWETNTKTLVRKDTGETISVEAIRDSEHQRHFDDLKKEQDAEKEKNLDGVESRELVTEKSEDKSVLDPVYLTCDHACGACYVTGCPEDGKNAGQTPSQEA